MSLKNIQLEKIESRNKVCFILLLLLLLHVVTFI